MRSVQSHWPQLDGVYGATANPIRLVFMMGLVWHVTTHTRLRQVAVLEVGSWCGASALTWGEAIKQFSNSGGEITCVDAWQPYVDLEINKDDQNEEMDAALRAEDTYQIFLHNLNFLPENVSHQVLRGWSQDILPSLPEERYDIVYLDGDHTYERVTSDLADAVKLVKIGGIICGDDLELQANQCDLSVIVEQPTIDKYFDRSTGTYFHPGVTKAVDECFGSVSSWDGIWAMQKLSNGWVKVSLDGMPPRIPSHIRNRRLLGLKALLMERGLL